MLLFIFFYFFIYLFIYFIYLFNRVWYVPLTRRPFYCVKAAAWVLITFSFCCCLITKQDGCWDKTRIYTFSIIYIICSKQQNRVTPCENVSSGGQRRLKSACASANRIIEYYIIYEWRVKARMILYACAWWSEASHFCTCWKALSSLEAAQLVLWTDMPAYTYRNSLLGHLEGNGCAFMGGNSDREILSFHLKRDIVNPLYTDTRYNDKILYNDNLNVTKPSLKRWRLMRNNAKTLHKIFKQHVLDIC